MSLGKLLTKNMSTTFSELQPMVKIQREDESDELLDMFHSYSFLRR